MRNQKYLILFNSIPFFLTYFNNKNVIGSWILKEIPLPLMIVRKVSEILGFSLSYWYGSWKKELHDINTVIIFAKPRDFEVINYIKKKNPSIRIIYYYWNPVSKVDLISEKYLENVELWSFDLDDCLKYNMKFNSTFYFKEIDIPNINHEFDILFLGLNKGRKDFLVDFEKKAKDMNISTYFHIIPDDNEDNKDGLKRVAYEEYLKLIAKSKAILDIVPKGQAGLTVRSMESIFLNKKLITSDITIIHQDFYKKENIFIIGHDDYNCLKNFINTPYVLISEKIIDQYDLNGWLKKFNN